MVIPATPVAVRTLLLALEGAASLAGLSDDERECTLLVLAEAMNNIVEHGYAGSDGWIILQPGPGRTGRDWCIIDSAVQAPPEDPAPSLLLDPLPEGGFGWPLIIALTERVTLRRRAGFNLLSLMVRRHNALQLAELPLAKIA